MVIWIAAVMLIIAVALFVAAPLADYRFAGGRALTAATASEGYRREHALELQALRELEFDYAMGKLGADDYHQLKQRLEIRALAAMIRQATARRASPQNDGVEFRSSSQSSLGS